MYSDREPINFHGILVSKAPVYLIAVRVSIDFVARDCTGLNQSRYQGMIASHLRQLPFASAIDVRTAISHIHNVGATIKHQGSGDRRAHLGSALLTAFMHCLICPLYSLDKRLYQEIVSYVITTDDIRYNRLRHTSNGQVAGLSSVRMPPHTIGHHVQVEWQEASIVRASAVYGNQAILIWLEPACNT